MKKHICLIDDDDDIREVLKMALEEDGFHVSSFSDPIKALECLSASCERPDFILTDYLMPGMNGLHFLRKLREDFSDTLGSVPFALSSANVEFIEKAPPGVLRLTKPMDLDTVLSTVRDNCL